MATKLCGKNPWPKRNAWGQRSCRGQLGSSRVNLLSNALWSPNLVRRTPEQSEMHCWGQGHVERSSGVKKGSICSAMPYGPPNLVGRTPDHSVMHCWGLGRVGVSWGQVGVNLLSNALWPPHLVGRTPDRGVMHCWGQRACRGQPGSTRGQIL